MDSLRKAEQHQCLIALAANVCGFKRKSEHICCPQDHSKKKINNEHHKNQSGKNPNTILLGPHTQNSVPNGVNMLCMILKCISAEKVLLLIMDTVTHEGRGSIREEKGMTQGGSGLLYYREITLRGTNYTQ